MKLLLHDNFDSFTYLLADYFLRLGADLQIVHNQEQLPSLEQFDGLILSPGPDRPANAGNLMEVVQRAADERFPTFGVCLGHQAMGEFLGASLVLAHEPMHGRTSALQHGQTGIFQELPNGFSVMRYHSLVLKEKTSLFSVEAVTPQKEIMAIQANHLPWWGVQFHPESIQTDFGLKIIENWMVQTSKN
jgi:anthranilate synthase/aminodeoxychorismate synthase-like glutamine amidotransferase